MLIECNKIIDRIKPVVITMNDEFVAGTTFTNKLPPKIKTGTYL